MLSCEQVQGEARGTPADRPELRRHLAACPDCARAVAEAAAVSRLLRSSLETGSDPARAARAALLAARAASRPLHGLPRIALACGLAVLSFSLAFLGTRAAQDPAGAPTDGPMASLSPTPSQAGEPAPATAGLVLDVKEPIADRLPFELRGAQGVETGELDLNTHYVLDTVPANAVVVDTF